jgi:hypothetical protein
MRPKGCPACVLISFVVAASFLGMGRVALRPMHSARTSPSSVEAPRLAGLTSGLKPRSPGSIPPLMSDSATRASDPQHNRNRGTAAAEAAHPCGAKGTAQATTYEDTRVRRAPEVPRTSLSRPFVPAAYPPTQAISSNFSLPIAFEMAGEATGQAVQYVGPGKRMTVLLESGGIEIVAGGRARPNPEPDSLQLRLVSSGAAQSTAQGTPRNGAPSAPTRHRRRRSGAKSKPRTLRRHNRQNMPRRDTPGHKGHGPLPQRPPGQRLPRETKPTSQLATPPANLTSGGQALIVLDVVTATNGETAFGRAPDDRRFEPTLRPLAAGHWQGIVLWLPLLSVWIAV